MSDWDDMEDAPSSRGGKTNNKNKRGGIHQNNNPTNIHGKNSNNNNKY